MFFIDEAYTKSNGSGDFSQEATNTLLPLMLNYKERLSSLRQGIHMIQQWINTNSGLESRFTKTSILRIITGRDGSNIYDESYNDQRNSHQKPKL